MTTVWTKADERILDHLTNSAMSGETAVEMASDFVDSFRAVLTHTGATAALARFDELGSGDSSLIATLLTLAIDYALNVAAPDEGPEFEFRDPQLAGAFIHGVITGAKDANLSPNDFLKALKYLAAMSEKHVGAYNEAVAMFGRPVDVPAAS
jgi:hypothetical protein